MGGRGGGTECSYTAIERCGGFMEGYLYLGCLLDVYGGAIPFSLLICPVFLCICTYVYVRVCVCILWNISYPSHKVPVGKSANKNKTRHSSDAPYF